MGNLFGGSADDDGKSLSVDNSGMIFLQGLQHPTQTFPRRRISIQAFSGMVILSW